MNVPAWAHINVMWRKERTLCHCQMTKNPKLHRLATRKAYCLVFGMHVHVHAGQ